MKVKIKVGQVEMYIDKNIAERFYPHLVSQLQDNNEKLLQESQEPSLDKETEVSQDESLNSSQSLPRKNQNVRKSK